MSQKLWSEVDDYYEQLIVKADPRFAEIIENSLEAGLPEINVSPCQGKFLELLVRFQRARRVLEVGTLGGYSSAWMARGLPKDGVLITLEIDPAFADTARKNLAQFVFNDLIEICIGDAIDSLRQLVESGAEPFDLIFIDADKTQYVAYLDWVLKLSRPGTLIIADNVVREGEVINPDTEDERAAGIREFNQCVATNPKLRATVLQTVGSKGHDGFSLIFVDD